MGSPGICCRCKSKNAIPTSLEWKNDGKNHKAGDEIRFRCGWIGFCPKCLPIVRKNHPNYNYVPEFKHGTAEEIVNQIGPSLDGLLFIQSSD